MAWFNECQNCGRAGLPCFRVVLKPDPRRAAALVRRFNLNDTSVPRPANNGARQMLSRSLKKQPHRRRCRSDVFIDGLEVAVSGKDLLI
jgi:hypothetical protein